MIAPLRHIVVEVEQTQNEEINIGGSILKTGRRYNENFREKNPVVALVVDGYGEIKKGSWIVCNYNYFEDESPFQINQSLFAIPVNEEIFAIIKEDGTLKPINGNVFVKRIEKQTEIEIPEELRKNYVNQGTVLYGLDGYYRGQHIFWLPYSDYEIVYLWNGEEKRAIKIHKSEIVGFLKK